MSDMQEPAKKPREFWPSATRLVKLLFPHKLALTVVFWAVII